MKQRKFIRFQCYELILKVQMHERDERFVYLNCISEFFLFFVPKTRAFYYTEILKQTNPIANSQ